MITVGDLRDRLSSLPASMSAARVEFTDAIELIVRKRKSRRSSPQNRRYWAMLTVAAHSLGWDDVEGLHDEIAHQLLALPACEKTGLRRRKRTPKLHTDEFARYTDDVARLLIEYGADLTGWEREIERQQEAA